ncbi:MFS general substrate transporter [Laetiporus sulphureus 93-53]|uniref:MFS general substrate transporter n=1 Tax=Laetiporus sulphureus 93-53 TaxID=1314785 RepID=A0A165GMZ8_9APHY|nr:MFS general substrate transporter [Laetiporus sulphureus 93-53]KZT10572.1 MFS general substrate transporter [Laetiporus sulphureus 93-53]
MTHSDFELQHSSTDTRSAEIVDKEEVAVKEVDVQGADSPTFGAQWELEIFTYHERNAGRLVIDPEEAKVEFGEEVARHLKLSKDGSKVLWPQPRDDPEDPQNWSDGRKSLQLFIITLAAIVPDFDGAIGIAALFQLAERFDTTTGVINNLTSNWSIFLLGWGSIFAVMLMRRYGRLPVLFWSQVLALAFVVGCTFSPNLNTFTAMRCLMEFFGTTPQVTGLFAVTDMYPFHLQARKLNVWTMGFIISPFLAPFALGFLAARANWRWTYAVGSFYTTIVVLLILFFGAETMYDRSLPKPNPIARPKSRLRYRIETLVGITGWRMARFRTAWKPVVLACANLAWRPHILSILVFEGVIFGFTTAINTTTAVFLAESPPKGYGFSEYAIAGTYGTPIVAVLLGEQIGHYLNDWIMEVCIRRNKGVFEAEMRLWTCYVSVLLYVAGFIVLGASMERLSIAGLVLGWGIAQCVVVFCTVAVYAYCNDCFPDRQGEISALVNLARTLGGFAVDYFQVPWATQDGALQTFGVEAAIVAALFLLIVPALQVKGAYLRARFSQ